MTTAMRTPRMDRAMDLLREDLDDIRSVLEADGFAPGEMTLSVLLRIREMIDNDHP